MQSWEYYDVRFRAMYAQMYWLYMEFSYHGQVYIGHVAFYIYLLHIILLIVSHLPLYE